MAKYEHALCRELWRDAKEAARLAGVTLPIKLTAMRSTARQFFVQGLNDEGEYIRGCCAFDAKAQRIGHIIDAAEATRRSD